MAESNTITVEDLKAPLLAAVGVADLTLQQVNETVTALRERAEEARSDAGTRVEKTREQLTKLRGDLPQRTKELRTRLTTEELRQAAQSYRESATEQYHSLVERGQTALDRRRSQTTKAVPARKAVEKKTPAPAQKRVAATTAK